MKNKKLLIKITENIEETLSKNVTKTRLLALQTESKVYLDFSKNSITLDELKKNLSNVKSELNSIHKDVPMYIDGKINKHRQNGIVIIRAIITAHEFLIESLSEKA